MFELLTQERWLLLLCALVFGALIGSFLNVVIYRLPVMMQRAWDEELAELNLAQAQTTGASVLDDRIESERFTLVVPRSRCGSCGHQITALENIPVVSWLALRGKCSACGAGISARYPLVELATALLFVACAWTFGPTLQAAAAMLLCAALWR